MAGEPSNTGSLNPSRDAEYHLAPSLIGPRQGLLLKDLDTANHPLSGIFPQIHSRVGLINSALHLRHSREEAA